MKVVSLVPSWTETLLHCGVNTVGRTRFCIHPENLIKNIPIVGGTKNWDWKKILELKPDLILLDQEENPRFMSEQKEIPWVATHVKSAQDMPAELRKLAKVFSNFQLENLADRWDVVLDKKASGLNPGILEWGLKPSHPVKKIVYVIWKDPWMAISQDTFIGSVLNLFGIEVQIFSEKYPKINLEDYSRNETLLLFSSEPYPFLKKKKELATLGFPYAFVDGEAFSWFGLRSLLFLERSL